MQLLRNLPLGYTALLKDIKLINFTIDPRELDLLMPYILPVEIAGEPVISMLDVKLYRLKPSVLLNIFHFTYRHIAFRVLVRDNHLHDDNISRGFFYMHSFANRPFVARFGKLFTNFNFNYASINENENENNFSLRYGNKFINYNLDPDAYADENDGLKNSLMQIDRAYSIHDNKLQVTKVKRAGLPLQPIRCNHFETNFFKQTKLIGAFRVKEELSYEWLPPQRCNFVQGTHHQSKFSFHTY